MEIEQIQLYIRSLLICMEGVTAATQAPQSKHVSVHCSMFCKWEAYCSQLMTWSDVTSRLSEETLQGGMAMVIQVMISLPGTT